MVDKVDALDISSSDEGSSVQAEVVSRHDGGSANGGLPWDLSGVPVDYSLAVGGASILFLFFVLRAFNYACHSASQRLFSYVSCSSEC